MTDKLEARLRASNPVRGEPRHEELATVLAVIEARRSDVTTKKDSARKTEHAPESPAPRTAVRSRWRLAPGWTVAAAVAVLVIAAFAIPAVLFSDDESPVVGTTVPAPPTTAQTSTTAQTPTTSPNMEDVSLLPAGASCSDLIGAGYTYPQIVSYWARWDRPADLAAGSSGYPCASAVATDDIEAVFAPEGSLDIEMAMTTLSGSEGSFLASGPAVDTGLICESGTVQLTGVVSESLPGSLWAWEDIYMCGDGSGSFTVRGHTFIDDDGPAWYGTWEIVSGTRGYEATIGSGYWATQPTTTGIALDDLIGRISLDPDATFTPMVEDVGLVPAGASCSDLVEAGHTYPQIVSYWARWDRPADLVADSSGYPCTGTADPGDVAAVFGAEGWLDIEISMTTHAGGDGSFLASGPAVDTGLICPSGTVQINGVVAEDGLPGSLWTWEDVYICGDASGTFTVRGHTFIAEQANEDGPPWYGTWEIVSGTREYEAPIGSGYWATQPTTTGIARDDLTGRIGPATDTGDQ